jgi:metallophosphoesterase superfamily enzyme
MLLVYGILAQGDIGVVSDIHLGTEVFAFVPAIGFGTPLVSNMHRHA